VLSQIAAACFVYLRVDRDFLPELDRLATVIDDVDSPHVAGLVRVIPYFSGGQLQPWVFDAGQGKYDLDEFDPEWEHRLREYLEAAADRDLVVSLELWDDWQLTRGVGGAYDPGPDQAWNAHPFNPENNVNYGTDVLSPTTSECEAPFYTTVPENTATSAVLDQQQRYVDHYADIVADYPDVICDLSNESRAGLTWSRYWADYLRSKVDAGRLVGEMPSTEADGTGQCDPELSPPTLITDDRYDYVDCSQALSSHSFGSDTHDLVTGASERLTVYYDHMEATGNEKPVVVSKDYTNTKPEARPVMWSKFVAGAASIRVHRHGVSVWDEDVSGEDLTFVFDAIESLGKFVVETEFWRHRPSNGVVSESPAGSSVVARCDPGREYVVAVVDGNGGRLSVEVEPGSYDGNWYDPDTGGYSPVDGSESIAVSVGQSLSTRVPDGTETQVLRICRTTETQTHGPSGKGG